MKRRDRASPVAASESLSAELDLLFSKFDTIQAQMDLEHSARRAPTPPPPRARRSPSSIAPRLEAAERTLDDLDHHARESRQRAGEHDANAKEWERRAALAVLAKDDVLAREALARRDEHRRGAVHHEREAEVTEGTLAACRSALAELREALA